MTCGSRLPPDSFRLRDSLQTSCWRFVTTSRLIHDSWLLPVRHRRWAGSRQLFFRCLTTVSRSSKTGKVFTELLAWFLISPRCCHFCNVFAFFFPPLLRLVFVRRLRLDTKPWEMASATEWRLTSNLNIISIPLSFLLQNETRLSGTNDLDLIQVCWEHFNLE